MKCQECAGHFSAAGEGKTIDGAFYCYVCLPTEAPAKVEAKPVAPVRKRCPHYGVIREFFTVARESGANESGVVVSRGSVGCCEPRTHSSLQFQFSRKVLSGRKQNDNDSSSDDGP